MPPMHRRCPTGCAAPSRFPVAGRIAYPLAVTRASAQSAEARRFTAFVRSAQGQAILAKHGFGKP